MNPLRAALPFLAFALLVPAQAHACRVAAQPTALRGIPADGVVLARITSVEGSPGSWHATARAWALLSGSVDGRDFSFNDETHVICGGMYRPKPGRYVVLYLRRADAGMRVVDASAYWWARRGGDPRLALLNVLLPLGAARTPTREENRLLDLAEPRVTLPAGQSDLSGYTRVYARASAGLVTGRLLRSATPQRLIVDTSEELPTEATCGCVLLSVTVDLDDLWVAGRLPPFNP